MKGFSRIIVVFCLLFYSLTGFSQEKISYLKAESLTYQYFLSEKWDSLINTGTETLNADIDFFYLRIRLGKAYFEKNNFVKAALHFEKALVFNSSDSYSLSHLYYSYLNMGRSLDAYSLLKKNITNFDPAIKPIFIKNISADAGITYNNSNTNILNLTNGETTEWSELNLTKNIGFAGLGLSYFVHKNILITNYTSTLHIDNSKQIRIADEFISDNYHLYQNDVYVSSKILVAKGLTIEPAFHYIWVDFSTLFSQFDTSLNKVTMEHKNVYLKNYAASLSAEKRFSYFAINVSGAISSLNNARQRSGGIFFSAYPFGNFNLYSVTRFYYHKERRDNNFIAEQKIGGKLHKYLWAEIFGTYGSLKNYTEENAFIVHNINDAIKQRYGASLIIPFKQLRFTLKYQFIRRATNYSYFNEEVKTGILKYNNHFLMAALAFQF